MARFSTFVLLGLLLLLSPSAYCSGEKDALWQYLDALSKGDTGQLKTLLSADFEYDFYREGKLHRLSRAEELRSIERILHDLPSRQFAVPNLFVWDSKAFANLPLEQWNKVKIILPVFFEDSPKVHTDTIFRGAMLELEETLAVTLDGDHKILKIVEEAKSAKGWSKLSFGNLKQLYLNEGKASCRDDNGSVADGGAVSGDLVCTLFDRKSHKPLLIRVDQDAADGATVSHFYWPDRRRVKNLGF